jgi:hypothetical protein
MKTSEALRTFALSMVVYAILLIGAIWLLDLYPNTLLRIPIALAPAVPGAFAASAISREIGSRDELQRQIQLESFAFAFGATAIVALAIGLLEIAGVKQINGTFYVPIMVFLWGIGNVLASRRYQ